ncbi:MAG: hypothetical protein ACE15F_22280 [bacterium]
MSSQEAYTKICKYVRRAHWRVGGLNLYYYLVKSIFYALVCACVAAVLLKIFPLVEETPWIFVICVVLALPASLAAAWWQWGSLETTALLVDKRLRLKEKLSAAMEFGRTHPAEELDPEWTHAVLTDAARSIVRSDLKRAFPWQNPTEARWLWVPLLGLVFVLMVLPQWDALTGRGRSQAQAMERTEVKKEVQKLEQRQLVLERKAQEEKSKIAAELAKQIKELATDLSKGKIDKREALAKLSSVEQEWEQKKMELAETQPSLDKTKSLLQSQMTGALLEALEQNNFEKAAQELNKVQKQLKMENLDADSQKQLSEELKQLASRMNANLPLSKSLNSAAELLHAGELDAALNPLNLAELDLMDIKDLMEQIKLLDGALKDLKDSKFALAGKFGKCETCGLLFGEGEGFCDGSCHGNGQGKGKGAYGTSPWRPGDSRNQGLGMGGPGIGRGGKAPAEETETTLRPDKLPANFHAGPLLGVLPVDGQSLKGESGIITTGGELLEYKQAAEDALTKERVPLPFRYQVRAYFNAIESEAASSSASGSQTQAGGQETPAP